MRKHGWEPVKLNRLCLECQSRVCEHVCPPPRRYLTSREVSILIWLSEGLSNKELADAAGIGEGTVKVHMRNALSKLGLSTRLEAARWAWEHMELLKGPASKRVGPDLQAVAEYTSQGGTPVVNPDFL